MGCCHRATPFAGPPQPHPLCGDAAPNSHHVHGFLNPISFPLKIENLMILLKADVANLLGLSERRIDQLFKEGIAVRVSPGKYDAPATVRAYIAHVTAKAERKTVALDSEKELARLRHEQANAAELKNQVARKELLPSDEVEREWSDMVRKIRSGVLGLTSRIRARITFLDATHAEEINAEINLVLEELADDA